MELVELLCRKIPLSEMAQEYIACKTDGCTPAQIQEIIYSLIIQNPVEKSNLVFTQAEIDQAISRINYKKNHGIGFTTPSNNNGNKSELAGTVKII